MTYIKILTALIFSISFITGFSQGSIGDPGGSYQVPISGPTSVIVGATENYSSGMNIMDYSWWTDNNYGTIVNSTSEIASIKWNTVGSDVVRYEAQDFDNYYYGSLSVQINLPPTPDATFSYTYKCGSTDVTRSYLDSGAPYNWYWQTSSSGTSTTYSGATYSTTTGGYLYLRAGSKTSPIYWSTNSQYVGNIKVISTKPAAPNPKTFKDIGGGSITLQTEAVAGADQYYWYDSSYTFITSTSSPFFTISTTTSKDYYVSARNICGESGKSLMRVLVEPVPAINSAYGGINMGQQDQLSLNGSYDSYSWSGPENFTSSASSITTNGVGKYSVYITFGSETGSDTIEVRDVVENQNENYIISETILLSGVASDDEIIYLTADEKSRSITYFDGLGRAKQHVNQQSSPDKKDIVTPVEYDEYGRQKVEYLAYKGADDGLYNPTAITDQKAYYSPSNWGEYNNNVKTDNHPFAVKIFEPSPLNRVIKQGAPGTDWQPKLTGVTDANDHSVKFSYELNTTTDAVNMWQVNTEGYPYFEGQYPAGELIKKVTYDEKADQVIEFVDKLGQTILKKVQVDTSATEWAETYYVYDLFNRLRAVIPPQGNVAYVNAQVPDDYELIKEDGPLPSTTGKFMYLPDVTVTISPTVTLTPELIIKPYIIGKEALEEWVFQYKYDEGGRMVAKKVPGADWVFMVYDQWDRIVLTQDGNQRLENKWIFTKYDALNRPVMTGIVSDSRLAGDIQNALESETERFETIDIYGVYSNKSFPTTEISEYLTYTYYDSYNFTSIDFIKPTGIFNLEDNKLDLIQNKEVKGQVTGTKTKVLGTNPSEYITTVNFYDDRYRLIQTYTDNPYQTIQDRMTTQYDFAGQVRHTFISHNYNGTTHTVEQRFEYDHAGRIEDVFHNFNGTGELLLTQNQYNDLGELIEKRLHSADNGSNFAQYVDYAYNIRGWLTKINESNLGDGEGDYFGMNFGYNEDIGLGATSAYNGNISAVKWSNIRGSEKGYNYSYDPMNRITAAQHKTNSAGWITSDPFSLDTINYDLNGNIQNLTRHGDALNMDVLAYAYDGNQLLSVRDDGNDTEGFKDGNASGNDYIYDLNGNMSQDLNKSIKSITYNYLNLPQRVEKSNEDYIDYIYDAAGIKLRQLVNQGGDIKTTNYAGSFIYQNDTLQFVQHEEGRIVPAISSYSATNEYQYHLKDHLGNTRVTFTSKPVTEFYATFETENEQSEINTFSNIVETRVTFLAADANNDAGNEVVRVNIDQPMGAGISLRVEAGDTINTHINAYYEGGSGYSSSNTLTALVTAVAGGFGGVAGGTEAQQTIYDAFDNAYSSIGLLGTYSDNVPAAYLNYILFDENFVMTQFGYTQISSSANWSHELVSLNNIPIPNDGYIYIYVSNESASTNWVYFDDFYVEHKKSAVIQTDDYYPFGLTFNSYQRAGAKENKYLYNEGSERITDLELGVDMTRYRVLDPAIGRWWQVDPKADVLENLTPYNSMFNNPIRYNDPLGDCPEDDPDCNLSVSFTGVVTLGWSMSVAAKLLNVSAGVSMGQGEYDLIGIRDNNIVAEGKENGTGEKETRNYIEGSAIVGGGVEEVRKDGNLSEQSGSNTILFASKETTLDVNTKEVTETTSLDIVSGKFAFGLGVEFGVSINYKSGNSSDSEPVSIDKNKPPMLSEGSALFTNQGQNKAVMGNRNSSSQPKTSTVTTEEANKIRSFINN